MKTLSRFVAKFTSLIVGVLSCFDRVIFKGYLPFTNGPALEGFVDHVLRIRRKDFMAFAEGQFETLVDSAKRLAQEAGAESDYLQGSHCKDRLVERSCDGDRFAMGWSVSSAAWNAAQASGWSMPRTGLARSTHAECSACSTSTPSIPSWA